MARNISANALAELAKRFGTEPINIIEIQWAEGGGRAAYSDRQIESIEGRIIEISDLDNVINITEGGSSQDISVTLDDTDGSIKAVMDTQDIHMRPCWVYQWFEGLDLDDKFLVFKGVVNSPLEWNEGDRTVRFDVLSKLEDVEVGFSIEEGNFTNPPEEVIGKPWPLVFGTVLNVPALRLGSPRRGLLATGTGIRDFTLDRKLRYARQLICSETFQGFQYTTNVPLGREGLIPYYQPDPSCVQNRCTEIERLKLEIAQQTAAQFSPVRIFGGNGFPQNVNLTLNIGGGLFTGRFNGDLFTITGRRHPKDDGRGNVIQEPVQAQIKSTCEGRGEGDDALASCGPWPHYLPQGLQGLDHDDPYPDGVSGQTPTLMARASRCSHAWYNSVEEAGFFWANVGSGVTIEGDQEIIYICNLLPSTVLRVAAYRTIDGIEYLLTVPEEYYTVRQVDYTGYTGVTEIVMNRPLSTRNEGWHDNIYVTLTSSVGPNTVDIIEWFIQTYTSYTTDSVSFDNVRALIDNYPMHFALLDRKNLIQVLEDIAFQARCALWLKDETFYIKYLAEEPTPDGEITESDVLENSMVVYHTPTEELVTKYVARWVEDYALLDKPNTVILRHNVKKYGTHEDEYNFYCFNILDLVRKAATFWLIRKANTWRRVRFNTPLTKLNLEVFDCVDMTLPDVADGNVKCIVEKANYNSNDQALEFELWTPVKSGTRTPYIFAYPADIDETLLFPTIEERELGLAGSGSGPNFVTIAPPGHPLDNRPPGLYQSISLACNGSATESFASDSCRPDHGTKKPSDRGDTKPQPRAAPDSSGQINVGTNPVGGSSDCCAEAKRLAEQALKEAQDAKEEAQNDGSEDSLPEECGGSQPHVKITYMIPRLVQQVGQIGCQPEGCGRTCTHIVSRTECVQFNSDEAAKAFAKQIEEARKQKNQNWGECVGEETVLNHSLSTGGGAEPSQQAITGRIRDTGER